MTRRSLVIRSIWATCLLIGAANHARILLRHGLCWDYGGVSWASSFYWSSLTILDPLVAALLFLRPKIGIASTLVLIVSNVIHNLAVTSQRATASEIFSAVASSPSVLLQIGFMIFVVSTARIAWEGAVRTPIPKPPNMLA